MKLSKLATPAGPRWHLDGRALPPAFTLATLLALPTERIPDYLAALDAPKSAAASGAPLAAVDSQEIWASGVTYLRSRDARKAESSVADVYQTVYDAERPELFMKAAGWRAVGPGAPVRIRADATWNVPEPELVLVINSHGEIVGYTAGNDMSSRDIEGANPLYLPQAKIYNGSCAIASEIVLCDAPSMAALDVSISITRAGAPIFSGATSIARMKRTLGELADWLFRELAFPHGALLMTGTGVVPDESFTLAHGDQVDIVVGEIKLGNIVA